MKFKDRKKSYIDDWDIYDDDIDGYRDWNLQEKLESDRYCARFVRIFESGNDFDLRYFQSRGYNTPIMFKDKAGLGIRTPSDTFTVNDVKQCVGARRLIDVIDVQTQKALVMNMRDWCNYYNNPKRDRLLNVISLEFSHTKLDHYVESPTVVRQIDWVDRVWPPYLREMQTNTTNDMTEMKYPKVRKYVLMSVGGCYTDFHVDFGGTSVWYHILRGEKIFWVIPPTEHNLRLYEEWCLSGNQGAVFFPDLIPACERIRLCKGTTFFIPPGWIHGVYTPEDSLVFGGNYLHTFGARLQLRVWKLEDATHVKMKFRYPFYTELHWYVLARYVACLMNKEYVVPAKEGKLKVENVDVKSEMNSEEEQVKGKGKKSKLKPTVHETIANIVEQQPKIEVTQALIDKFQEVLEKAKQCEVPEKAKNENWVHLTKFERDNLQIIVNWLSQQPLNRQAIPSDLINPEKLLHDAQIMINMHYNDDFYGKAVTGVPILKWNISKKGRNLTKPPRTEVKQPASPRRGLKSEGGPRRRIRCMRCEPCRRTNCLDCAFCRDMVKYGGPGVMKKCCIQKGCIAPLLPISAICTICSQMDRSTDDQRESDDYDPSLDLFECGICWTITHPKCIYEKSANRGLEHVEGSPNEDLPNYWECPDCIRAGKKGTLRPRVPRGLTILKAFENAATEGGPVLKPTDTSSSDAATSADAPKPKRRVGRPRKHKMELTTTSKSVSPPDLIALKNDSNSTAAEKRKRMSSTKKNTMLEPNSESSSPPIADSHDKTVQLQDENASTCETSVRDEVARVFREADENESIQRKINSNEASSDKDTENASVRTFQSSEITPNQEVVQACGTSSNEETVCERDTNVDGTNEKESDTQINDEQIQEWNMNINEQDSDINAESEIVSS